jgi:hypothetical protein
MTNRPILRIPPLRLARWLAMTLLMAFYNLAVAQNDTPLASEIGALKKVPFEELFNLEVTTVSRRPERLVDAASAIQVISV